MPQLVRTEHVPGLYDEKSKNLGGVPMEYYVRPVVRQGGLGQDIPKGMELPSCMVDPCCAEEPFSAFDVLGRSLPRVNCDVLEVTWEVTLINVSGQELTNISTSAFPLDFPGVDIVSGDTEIAPATYPTLAPDATIVLTATTTYSQPVGPLSVDFTIPEGFATSDQGQNLFGAGMFANLCPPV